MDEQAFELLMENIRVIRDDVEELKKFRWKLMGAVTVVSVTISTGISVLLHLIK